MIATASKVAEEWPLPLRSNSLRHVQHRDRAERGMEDVPPWRRRARRAIPGRWQPSAEGRSGVRDREPAAVIPRGTASRKGTRDPFRWCPQSQKVTQWRSQEAPAPSQESRAATSSSLPQGTRRPTPQLTTSTESYKSHKGCLWGDNWTLSKSLCRRSRHARLKSGAPS